MKSRLLIASLLLLSLSLVAWVSPFDGFRKLKNDSFQKGEYLEFRVHYGAITAGTARLEVKPETVKFKGRDCFRITGEGTSSRAFSLFFPVHDTYEAIIDKESLFTWEFIRGIDEGSFKQTTHVTFDQVNHKASETRSTRPGEVFAGDVPPNIQDALGAMYFARTQDYTNAAVGEIFEFQNYIDSKVHDLNVQFLGFETIKVEGTEYRAVKLQPMLKEGGIFRHDGDLYLWISADMNRIPLRIESGLVIGSIKVDLVEARNLRHPFTAKLDD
ncbi:MAG: DUF3108 domain-containing protein [Bacteroidia bacterium]|nr:DUF3108 domain-containing protein [Bacteroidia bacterium]